LKIKDYIIPHANHRYYERAFLGICDRRELINHITNGGTIYYAKRSSSTRSLVYVPIEKRIHKIIMNRKTLQIITFLPWISEFHVTFRMHSEHYDNKNFHIDLYPDCYLETNCKTALTKIYINHDDGTIERLPHNHPFFEGLFDLTWKHFDRMEDQRAKAKIKDFENLKPEFDKSKYRVLK
jgi:hypothetical protein